ncbi:MAG TPA: hypothetical protein VGX51_02375 [Solirubrobacteraceae bacterium]|jgi:hypothetical protein|nr:hypothetical protein [Solirubrobacteraceae bacterium]
MRRLLLMFALALTLSAVGASSALAAAPEGAQKAQLYGPFGFESASCGSGAYPTPETFGFVVLNTPGDETTLTGEVALKHAAPNTTYSVRVAELVPPPLGACFERAPGVITTNKQGNGNLHFTTARVPSATTFEVKVVSGSLTEVYASSVVELD